MAMPLFNYRVPTALYLSALIAFLAIGALAAPLSLAGLLAPAVLAAAAGLAGMTAALALWMRRRTIELSAVGMTLPVGPFAAQVAFIPYRHMLTVTVEKRTGGQVLTVLHRSGKVSVPASCLPRAQDVHHLRDVLTQQINQIAGRARPISATARGVAHRPPQPAAKTTFGKRATAA